MNAPAAEPKPKRSRRMIVWLVVVPIVILLLALAGANWKTFHLAYCKHLMRSTDSEKQNRGFMMVVETHLRESMSLEEVRAILVPAKITEGGVILSAQPLRRLTVGLEGSDFTACLGFDEDDRLRYIEFIPYIVL